MKKYYELLGLSLEDVIKYFNKRGIEYTITTLQGKKDKDKLVCPRVIKITELENKVEIFVTYFSDSLV